MSIEIKGDPGTGNTFMEINIHHVGNFCPAATSVINNNYGTRTRQQDAVSPLEVMGNTGLLRTEILSYVDRLRVHLSDEWKGTYRKIWEDILDIEVVSVSVYRPGKQHGTNFNRNLVANIIHYLYGQGAYLGDYNAAHCAEYLDGNKEHSIRSALGKDPSSDIVSRLNRYFDR